MNSEQNEYSASSVYDYPFSFSGTDVEAYIIQGNYSYKLNSLSTVSFQVNEQKSPVRRLGYVSPVGFTRAIRTIAGTLVLTVLKDHPFSIIKDGKRNTLNLSSYVGLTSFLGDNKVVQNQTFDLLLRYQSEGNRRFYSEFKIIGINLISQSMVTSVNDMVTEMVFQFMAKDFDDFKLIENEAQKQEFNKVNEAINEINRINQLIAKLQREIDTLDTLIASNTFKKEEDRKIAEEGLKKKKEELEKLKQDLEKIQGKGTESKNE